MMGHCPRCSTPLEQTTVGTVHVDGCHGCGGVWFDHRELGQIAQAHAADLKELDARFVPGAGVLADGNMLCPVCDVVLFEFEFKHSPGIKLDACPQCRGIWADNGELMAIYDRITRSLSRAATAARPAVRTLSTRQKARQAVHFLTSRQCHGCGEANPRGSLVCWACGQVLAGQQDKECPDCEIPLRQHTFDAVGAVDVCPACCGVWLDHRELANVVRRTDEELRPLMDAVSRPSVAPQGRLTPGAEYLCPVCSAVLEERQYGYNSGIRIDVCEECGGVWLGADELRQTVEYYRREQGLGG